MTESYKTTPPPAFTHRSFASMVLDEGHLNSFQQAIANILTTQIAEETLAQIVDGLPLARVIFQTSGSQYQISDQVREHQALCPGVTEKVRCFRDEFDASQLLIDNMVLQQYQNAKAGSAGSELPLFELVAVAIHAMAVELYRPAENDHARDDLAERSLPGSLPSVESDFVPFALPGYNDASQYTDGAKEFPGYWAEDRIFGGVVLFSRGPGGNETNEIWFHSFRDYVTSRIYALTSQQKLDFYNFLRADSQHLPPCPLPILGNQTNRERVDSEIAIPRHNIYRERWERKITVRDHDDYLRRRHCVKTALDYPELADYFERSRGSRNKRS